ncbi:Uncharacterized protein HZ326_23686 [Fusarium oxysporum f. sp. albedinis]|nr:Uncharacterized protein HZ326_23686 [Fusarium oxysporum f. sp. albedinis]
MTLCLEANQEEKRIQQLSSWNTQEPSSKTRANRCFHYGTIFYPYNSPPAVMTQPIYEQPGSVANPAG